MAGIADAGSHAARFLMRLVKNMHNKPHSATHCHEEGQDGEALQESRDARTAPKENTVRACSMVKMANQIGRLTTVAPLVYISIG